MAEILCPICRHLPPEHDAEGRCLRGGCSCRIDRRTAFETLPFHSAKTWGDRLFEGAMERPIGALIAFSCGLGLLGALMGWLPDHFNQNTWMKEHRAGFKAIENGLLLMAAPGLIAGYFYVPNPSQKVSDSTFKILAWGLVLLLVATGVLYFLDRFWLR